jgi:hypothetical protein
MPVKRYNGSSWDVVAGAGVTGAPGSNGTNGTNGIDAAPTVAGKNALINGACEIWQRGTSFPSGVGLGASVVYSADRWHWYRGGNDVGATLTRQSAGLTGFNYCMRIQRNSGNTSTQALGLRYTLETADSLRFAGKSITFSFYARKGADYSPTGSLLRVYLPYGTGTDQVVHSFTGFTNVVNSTATLTSTWTRFTYTASIPSNATEIGLEMFVEPVGTAGANDYMEITGLQLEEGTTATAFSRAMGTYQGELAACMRYFQSYNNAGSTYVLPHLFSYADGSYFGTTVAEGPMILPVQMRVAPTLTTTGTFAAYAFANHGATGTLSLEASNPRNIGFRFDKSSGSWTSSVGYANTSNGYINLHAEL